MSAHPISDAINLDCDCNVKCDARFYGNLGDDKCRNCVKEEAIYDFEDSIIDLKSRVQKLESMLQEFITHSSQTE